MTVNQHALYITSQLLSYLGRCMVHVKLHEHHLLKDENNKCQPHTACSYQANVHECKPNISQMILNGDWELTGTQMAVPMTKASRRKDFILNESANTNTILEGVP